MACLHGMRIMPTMINLIEASKIIPKHSLCLYNMCMVDMSKISSTILMVYKARKNGPPLLKLKLIAIRPCNGFVLGVWEDERSSNEAHDFHISNPRHARGYLQHCWSKVDHHDHTPPFTNTSVSTMS
jgi:hypothetical protein